MLVLAGHTLAVAVLPPLALPRAVNLALAGAIIISLVHATYTHMLRRGARTITALEWQAEAGWTLETAHGVRLAAQPLPGAVIYPACIALRFQTEAGRPLSVVLLPDSADADALRRIRVRLRLAAVVGDPPLP